MLRVAPRAAVVLAVSHRCYADHSESVFGQHLLRKDEVLTRVLGVVKDFNKVDAAQVSPESHFIIDLGLDSIDVVEVIMALEKEFAVDLPDRDAEMIQSIQDAVQYIAKNLVPK